MNDTKTMSEWEQVKGCIVTTATQDDLSDPMTEEEFDAIPKLEKHGVNYSDRIKFLQDNGYELTRANMIDSDLSATKAGQL